METHQRVETAEESVAKASPPQTVEGVVEAWVVRAERLPELRLVSLLPHLAGAEVVAQEVMGKMQGVPI
jgi:hypothetical protein